MPAAAQQKGGINVQSTLRFPAGRRPDGGAVAAAHAERRRRRPKPKPRSRRPRPRLAERERIKKCGKEWKEAKAAGKVEKGMKWPQYWSACNKRLKAAGG